MGLPLANVKTLARSKLVTFALSLETSPLVNELAIKKYGYFNSNFVAHRRSGERPGRTRVGHVCR